MSNGVAVHLPPVEPASTPAVVEAVASTPPADKPATEIDLAIGEEVASGVVLLCAAIAGYHARGVIDLKIKDAVAVRIANIAMLGLNHALDDVAFVDQARRAGQARLRALIEGHTVPPNVNPDVVNAICMDELLAVVAGVVASERAYVAARAN